MSIIVCPLSRAPHLAREHGVSHVVSLLDPGTPFPVVREVGKRHLRMEVHDVEQDMEEIASPRDAHIKSIIDFVREWDRAKPMLVHCYAGISRSTAAAFITACVHNPTTPELEIAQALRAASAMASPNRRMVQLADAALERRGRMFDAVFAIGRGGGGVGYDEAQPFTLPSRFGA